MNVVNLCRSLRFICQTRVSPQSDNKQRRNTTQSRRRRRQGPRLSTALKRTFIVMERQLQRIFQQGFQHAVSRRQESWVYRKRSGHFLHLSWRATGEQSSQRQDWLSPDKRRDRTRSPARGDPRRPGKNRRRGSEGQDGTRRSSRTVSGWLAVCRRGWLANSWRRRRRRAEGAELWRSYTSPSMCGDGRRWRQTPGRAGTLPAAR